VTLRDERLLELLATVKELGVPEDSLDFWRIHVLPTLCDSDFWFDSFRLSRGTLDVEGRLETLEYYEKIVSIILTELGIRVPRPWSFMPQVMAFVALQDTTKPGTLQTVREALGNFFALCGGNADLLKTVSNELPGQIRHAHEILFNFICGREGSNCYGAFLEFRTLPMEEAARRISKAVGCQLGTLQDSTIELGRKWGLFPAEGACLLPELSPPSTDVTKADLYLMENVGAEFVSVDLRRADFAILRLFAPALGCRQNTWEKFVQVMLKQAERESSHGLPKNGFEKFRGLRTRLLGKLAHRKNAVLQSHVLRLIARAIARCAAGNPDDEDVQRSLAIQRVFRFSCDELIIRCEPSSFRAVMNFVNEAIGKYLPDAIDVVRVEAFQLCFIEFNDQMTARYEKALATEEPQDSSELLQRGHPALKMEKYQEPEFEIDEAWEDSQIPRKHPSNGYFVRRSLLDRGFEVKCLPTSLLADGFLLTNKSLNSASFGRDWMSLRTETKPPPLRRSLAASGETALPLPSRPYPLDAPPATLSSDFFSSSGRR
jgi:hypothetical protein